MNSTFGKINWLDILKGFVVAIFSALITGVYQIIQSGTPIVLSWAFFQPIVYTAVAAGLAYLIKNVFTNSDGKTFVKEV